MLPILLDLKFIKIYTFGVFAVLAFFLGSYFFWKHLKLTSYKEDEMFDSVFVALIWALFWGRLVYVICNFEKFGFSPLKFILINGFPGLSAWGAIGGATVGLYVYLQRKNRNFARYIDYYITPIFIAASVIKIGSFFAGSEVGTRTKFILSVAYVGYEGMRHIPTLYEAILYALAAFFSYKLLLAIRRGLLPYGFNYWFFLIVVSSDFLLLDKLKENHLYLAGVNVNVVVSSIVFIATTSFFLYHFRREIGTIFAVATTKTSAYGKKTYQNITKTIANRTPKTGKRATKAN